jgi:hypothetical protein
VPIEANLRYNHPNRARHSEPILTAARIPCVIS